jgi:hypothetical protein
MVGFLKAAFFLMGLVAGTCATLASMAHGYVTTFGHHGCYSRLRLSTLRVRAARDASIQFMIEHGACPSSVGQLANERFVDGDKLRDAWGVPLLLECPVARADAGSVVRSAGPDGQFGTADDITAD